MRHPDADDLALVAVSTGVDLDHQGDVTAHVADCPVCQAEVEVFRYVAELVHPDGSGPGAPRELPPPGAHVWAGIAAELGLPDAAAPRLTAVPDLSPVPGLSPVPDRTVDPAAPPATSVGAPSRRPAYRLAVAALVVGAALGAGAMAVTRPGDTLDPTRIEASTRLDPVPGGPLVNPDPTLGTAQLVAVDDGQWVVVSTEELPLIAGAYEVWLFGDGGRMVALGALQAGQGRFSVPAGIDTREYRTIDISDEPADGNPAHSGVSVVRGTLG